MPQYTEQQLKQSLEQEQFARVYFFCGEEKLLMQKAVDRLIALVTGNQFLDFNYQNFDGAFADVQEILTAAQSMPFMAERKCVAISDFDIEKRSASDVAAIKELIADPPPCCVLLFYLSSLNFPEKRPGKWGSFITAVNKTGVTVRFSHKTSAEIEKLLMAAAQKRGCTLSRQNAAHLLSLSGNDLQTLHNELEKLCAFTGSGEITKATIEQVAVPNFETTVFLMANALAVGDYSKAQQRLALLFAQNEEPVAILAVLSSVYVDFYRVRACEESGRPLSELTAQFDYKGKEFRLKNARRDCKLSMQALRQSLQLLLETNVALKSARADGKLLLQTLLAKLQSVAEGGEAQ